MKFPTSIKRNIDVSNELTNYQLEACNNIDVLLIPSGVEAWVSFKRDAPFTHMYPLYTNATNELKNKNGFADAELIYIHTKGTSSTTLDLNLSVIDNSKSSFVINKHADKVDITDAIMDRLDKFVNPYLEPELIFGSTDSDTALTILYKDLACDKINISLNLGNITIGTSSNKALIYALIDGNSVVNAFVHRTASDTMVSHGNYEIELENIRGKRIAIIGLNQYNTNKVSFVLKEYTLKP